MHIAGDDHGSVGYPSADVFWRFILVFGDMSHLLGYLPEFCGFHLGQLNSSFVMSGKDGL